MKTAKEKEKKLLNQNTNFNEIIPANLTHWKFILFLIVILELCAALFEYIFIGSSHIIKQDMPHSLTTEFIMGIGITAFVWAVVYNIIYWNKRFFIYLFLLAMVSLYLIVTHDYNFNFLLNNLNPSHIFNLGFSFALFIELLFKVIITYLIFKLIISLKKSKQ